jgi:hypothetical protein
MKRLFLGAATAAFAAVAALAALVTTGCGADPEPPAQPTIIEKDVGGERVKFIMLDGDAGKKLFLRLDQGVQCTAEGCTSCADGSCLLDGGCSCRFKACAPLCQPHVQLPVDGELALELKAPPSPASALRTTAEDASTSLQKRLEELEKRVRELEASP